MKIFLTGGTGFIGSHFINAALNAGHEIKALRRSDNSAPKVQIPNKVNWLTKQFGDVTINDLQGTDLLVHLAAHSANVPYDSLENCIKYNVTEPLKLFKIAKEAGVKKIIVTGSCFEYGLSGERYEYIPSNAPLEPSLTYPTSKAISSIAFKQFAIENKVQLNYFRIFQVYGEGELESRLWPSLKKAALKGEDFPMTMGGQIRDFIEVKSLANTLVVESEKIFSQIEINCKISNIGTGVPQSILEFSKYWWSKWNAKGSLLIGDLKYREGEIMRYVPLIENN